MQIFSLAHLLKIIISFSATARLFTLICPQKVTKLNLNFGILSLNVRGIRSFDKRKALFHWCMKDKADIIFLQETYSTPEVGNTWKSQWRGYLFFCHGCEHSRGVITLVKEGLDCKFEVCKQDNLGRYIILKGLV